ncbi:LamG domain-containing protein [Endozoicomonas sp. ISHI1]|uniref:LamG domain-containing protein n=1 Tax=Endozoicomonas sp. ISHI1 TaxID=2825882 RepID=UPI0021488473|nr:LamG domain-containing protein [Endozoicomonas sp. ISHI1]
MSTTISERLEAATQKAESASDTHQQVTEGDDQAWIPTESGNPIPSIRNVQRQWNDQVDGDLTLSKQYRDESGSNAVRAEAAADRADQIADLETVRDALRLAAVPAPDFHLPLISDLRIEEGFGPADQVDVSAAQDGSLMVDLPSRSAKFAMNSEATFMDKSNVIKKVASDQPRFEKYGYLSEPASTNLHVNSENMELYNYYGNATIVRHPTELGPDRVSPAFLVSGASNLTISSEVGHNVYHLFTGVSYPIGEEFTASLFVKAAPDNPSQAMSLRLTGDGAQSHPLHALTDEWQRVEHKVKVSEGGIPRMILGNSPTGDFLVCFPQTEKLPFATSYISTAETAVTRSAPFLKYAWKGNFDPRKDFTISIRVRLINPRGYSDVWKLGSSIDFKLRYHNGGLAFFYGSANGQLSKTSGMIVMVKSSGLVRVYVDGVLLNTASYSEELEHSELLDNFITATDGVINIRDFMLWASALSAEQVSALGAS